ncbi:protocadherin gamma-C5-like isoform X22 [Spea bombifrons]|uniref:protocadherin gamma-C5-like isoform X22 n=1 Tax=Spea bombifrons TaxID=233779 RepID=UPI00234BC0C8|nr:protocadherin gamma-C5-like isoform X22 [Spea bombifrons]
MDFRSFRKAWIWQVIHLFFLCSWVSGQLRYSVVEESDLGTVVGNIARDLGLILADIPKRRLQLGSEGSRRHFFVNQANGDLTVIERIDRESLCGSSISCLLHIEVIAENPLELISLEIEIVDINDNSPIFPNPEHIIKITELVEGPGAHFSLETAQDMDVGVNGISEYSLSPNPYFSLSVKNRKDGVLIPELVLEKGLDRESNTEHKLKITAIDGGDNPRSGSCQITVIVIDINDNAPVFEQSVYKIHLMENQLFQAVVIDLNATDPDEGSNGEILYFYDSHIPTSVQEIFGLNPQTGVIYIKGTVDYEESNFHELIIKAKDHGVPSLVGRCVIQIEVEDENDNPPEITFTSMINELPENAALGTAVGFLSIKDRDFGKNGEVQVEVSPSIPFKVNPFKNHYSLVTSGRLDREKISQYNIHLTATDLGSPPLSSQTKITLNISDINDNPPVFVQPFYNAFIRENNDAGSLLCTLSAFDQDEGVNAEVTYGVIERQIDGSSVSSFVYVNPKNGNIHAQRSFDYEHTQVLKITVRAEDSGNPKLFSNVTVFIFILDVNDHYPTVFYPELSKELIANEKIPRSASAGYLVAKVSAVDFDSGHNAWLNYSLIGDSDTSLFRVSADTGEIRLSRGLQESENSEKIIISVSDHGNPPLSTTVTIFFNIVDDIVQENPTSYGFITKSKPTSDVTLYLIISLVAISIVSLITFIILLVKCIKKENCDMGNCCFPTQLKPFTEQYQPTLYLNTDGTLKYMEVRMVPAEAQGQCYQSCFTPASEKNDLTFTKPLNFPHLKDIINETDSNPDTSKPHDNKQAQPNTEWRFSQAQRPGPSGAQPTEEAGVWPNNQFETERLQAMILASANEAAEGTSGLGGGTGTMGLSARYGPQFTLQHVPDYRQNVYIPGSTLTPTNAAGKRDGKSGGNKKKSGKKEKK